MSPRMSIVIPKLDATCFCHVTSSYPISISWCLNLLKLVFYAILYGKLLLFHFNKFSVVSPSSFSL